jgi:hypothetical protein
MFPQHDFRNIWTRIKPQLDAASTRVGPYLNAGSAKVIGAVAVASLAAIWIVSLPEDTAHSSSPSSTASAGASDLACETQAWPYIDHRCGQPAAAKEAASLVMRNVRVVSTDRGASANLVTALPTVEPKRPAEIPQLQESMAKLAPPTAQAELTPLQEKVAPQAPAVEAIVPAETTASVAKAKAAEKRDEDKRVAKSKSRRSKPVPTEMAATGEAAAQGDIRRKGVPADVVAAVKAASANEAPSAVPADVIDTVKALTDGRKATRAYKSRDGRRIVVSEKAPQEAEEMVSVGSPGRGTQRLFLVPRESGDNDWHW